MQGVAVHGVTLQGCQLTTTGHAGCGPAAKGACSWVHTDMLNLRLLNAVLKRDVVLKSSPSPRFGTGA